MPYIGRTLGQGTRSRFLYTATAGQTTFSGSDSQSNTLAYADNNGLDCFQNGVLLKGGGADYTATTGTSVVLTTGASVSDVIEILVYDVFAIADHVKKSGDAMTGALTNIDVNGTELILDADGDTSITADTDDQIDIKVGGSDKIFITTTGLGVGTSTPPVPLASSISSNGGNIIAHRSSETNGDYGGIEFHNHPSSITSYRKGAIYFQSDGSGFGRGAITFCVDGAGDANNVSSSDEIARFGKGYYVGAFYLGNYKGTGDYDDPGYNSSTGITFRALNGSSPAIMTCSDSQHYIYKVGTGRLFDFNYKSSLGAGGSNVGFISTDGSNTTFSTSSDYRLKENISTDWDATTRLKQLKPSRFNWKANKDKTVDGFLAHEVSSIVPEAITGEKDAVDENGNPQYQGIDQSKLVPLLTKALQEAVAKIETLEAKVTALESK